ncbi:MAG TPA: hypothetical protein VI643_06370, partial [Planctomycetota bacterium]|nr:hypothetical protein [Planctomycetota bacterium]
DEEARLSRERIEGARDIVAQTALIVTHARSGIEVVREALRNVGPKVPGLDPIWAERLLQTMDQLHREASRLLGEPVEIKAGS